MLPSALPKTRRNGNQADDPIDPYELVRRLSMVQAEATIQELERKRSDWETSLLASRDDQHGQVKGRARTHSAPNMQSHKVHKRSKSMSLAPNQLPPLAYIDLEPAPRQQTLPSINRPQYTSAPRKPSLNRGDSGLDLETINEDVVVEPSLDNLFPQWSMAMKERRQSALRSADCGANIVSTQPVSRRRSSLLAQKEAGRQELAPYDALPKSRRQSALLAQKRHSRQDWSQSDESSRRGSRRHSSLLEKMGQFLKAHSDQGSEAGDIDAAFDSRASTLRSSWRSSMTGSTSSRRTSMLKKVGDFCIVKAPLSDDEGDMQDIQIVEEDPVGKHHAAKRMSGLFSKLRL